MKTNKRSKIIQCSQRLSESDHYQVLCDIARTDAELFWETLANLYLYWDTPFTHSYHTYSSSSNRLRWFPGGQLNISANCLDRHCLAGNSEKIALIWHSEDGSHLKYTYGELLAMVCKAGHALLDIGIGAGDVVAIYMPLLPQAIAVILACNRIGAIPCTLYPGLSGYALADRLLQCQAKLLVTADATIRNNQWIDLASKVKSALQRLDQQLTVVMLIRRRDSPVDSSRFLDWFSWTEGKHCTLAYKPMDADDPAFLIHTSGTTGSSKLVLHRTAGILTACHLTTLWCFDPKPSDVLWCTADLGWITSMAHVIYGPLSNGMSTLIYEGSIVAPGRSIPWKIVEQCQVTQLKISPSAIRALRLDPYCHVYDHNLASLRLVFCSGEPLDITTWNWINDEVLQKSGDVVDGWGQTETCSTMICSFPGMGWHKPGSVGKPLPGAYFQITDQESQEVLPNSDGYLSISARWPGLCDSQGSTVSSMSIHTGDIARIDDEGFFYILGRHDDVLNVSGCRISSFAIEQLIQRHPNIVDVAVVGRPHEMKGQCIVAFLILDLGLQPSEILDREIRLIVSTFLGSFAAPTDIIVVNELPRTHSGKVAKGYLAKLLSKSYIFSELDTSMIANPSILSDFQLFL